jgi:hypothetical protein
MYKIVNLITEKVTQENLDFYQARAIINSNRNLILMDQDTDVAEGLERRRRFIAA